MKRSFMFSLIGCMFCSLLLISCASTPGFSGKGDLCGLVIDENNVPVRDFVVNCRKENGSSLQEIRPVITNESGLFVFYGLLAGEYFLSGEKPGCLRILETPYHFNDRTKIICLQTKSFRASVLRAEELLRLGQPEEAGEVLGGICCETGSPEEIFFKNYIAKLKEGTK